MGCGHSGTAPENAGSLDASAQDAAGQDTDAATPLVNQGDGGPDVASHYGLDCPPSSPSTVPASSPRILILGPGYGPKTPAIAAHLQGMLGADSAFTAPVVTAQTVEARDGGTSLMNYYYFPNDRATRLAPLQEPWSYVVLLDGNGSDVAAMTPPEFYFEGVRVLGCSARAVGAKPVVLMPWSSVPGAPDVGEITYRVANGTNSIVAPAGYAWMQAKAQLPHVPVHPQGPVPPPPPPVASGEDLFVAAASLYSTLTGRNAGDTSYRPTDIPKERATQLAGISFQTGLTETAKVHYQTPFRGTIEMRTLTPGGAFWFMDSGTSSEQIWFDRMNEILPRAGLSPDGTQIGVTNPYKRVDAATITSAVPYFQQHQYKILLARGYDVDGAAITSAGAQTDLQIEVWDRHLDNDSSDGVSAVATMENQLLLVYEEARLRGISMIPYHLMFARIKTMRPSIALLSDGTHATYPVGYGLATMSIVSRTGIRASIDGLDADTQLAAQLADETIRQLSALSASGAFVPDDPSTRPTAP